MGTRKDTTPAVHQHINGFAQPIIAAGALLAILYLGRVVFITATIALILALILEPFVGLLVKLRIPRSISTFIVCLVGILALYFAGLVAWNQLSNLAGDVPAFRQNLGGLINGVSGRIQSAGESARRLLAPELMAEQKRNVQPAAQPRTASRKNRKEPSPPIVTAIPGAIPEVRIHEDRNPVVDYVYASLGTVYEFVLMASFVPFLVFFMLSWRDHIYRSFLRFFEGSDRVAAARSLEGVAEMARAFVVGNFLIGILIAMLSWFAFAAIKLPYSFVVGSLSGFLSLVPYVGMPLAFAPPVLAALAEGEPGSDIFFAFVIVLTLHLFAMNVLYPKIVGARVHLNPLVVTFSLMFWGFLWDAPGLLLAIPITAGIKAVFDNVAGLRPYGRFLGD